MSANQPNESNESNELNELNESKKSKEEGVRDIRTALSLLFREGAVVELRALGDGGVHSGYFTDFDGMAGKAAAMNRFTDVHGCYVTLNEVNPALLSRRANRVKQRLSRSDATTADADIIRRRWLPIDLDPVRPSGVSATDGEHAAALERAEDIADWLTERGFPAPVIADSGNGAHLLYRIDLPNDGEATRLVKSCLTVLDAVFSDDAVHCDTANFNAGRIWKCYGTTARKGDNTPERPHRTARICSAPDEPQVIPEEMLRDLADCIPRTAPKADTGGRRSSFDLRHWLDKNHIAVKTERPWQGGTLFSLAECPFSSAHTDGAFAIQFANGARFAGCHHDSCGGGTQRWQELRDMYEPERNAGKEKESKRTTSPDTHEKIPGATSPVPPVPDTSAEQQEHRKRALEILAAGDPLSFLLDVFHRDHVGDRTVAECLIMSVASQSVENTSGLHVAISGNSGKGKTHACNAMARLLPREYRLTGTVSDKALFYYDDLRPGTVLLFDDVTLSDDMQEVLKSATANFREPIVHRTLTRDRQLRVCTIPERCVWWLAKVESIGDDQVMNRMLTVWIDDSKEQDRAVLEHLKTVEADGTPSATADRSDLLVCREMWDILKGAVRQVRIPFARRVTFSTIQNRRNPAMLFDLIKCHTLLHFLQRETDADGALIATPEDFAYARKLFGAINSDGGSQETKLTKNEAAALETIARLGLEIFTTHQLQDAIGLSYHQTRRLLQGYTNTKASYTGILDKCPAISPIDGTVAEALSGMEIRRHERYFSFDVGIYREWTAQSNVWLKPDDTDDCDDDNRTGGDGGEDVCTFAPALHPDPGKSANIKNDRNDGHFCTGDSSRDRCTESMIRLHTDPITYSNPVSPGNGNGCVSDRGASVTDPGKNDYCVPIGNSEAHCPSNVCTSECNSEKTSVNVQTKKAGHTLPLPGILDHRDFQRSAVILGHCTLCGDGAAVYHSKSQRASICEGCYSRLVREWNKGEGVV